MYTRLSHRTGRLLGRVTQGASLSAARAEATYVANQPMPTAGAVLP